MGVRGGAIRREQLGNRFPGGSWGIITASGKGRQTQRPMPLTPWAARQILAHGEPARPPFIRCRKESIDFKPPPPTPGYLHHPLRQALLSRRQLRSGEPALQGGSRGETRDEFAASCRASLLRVARPGLTGDSRHVRIPAATRPVGRLLYWAPIV